MILDVFEKVEAGKEKRGWDVSDMIIKYSWLGSKRFFYNNLVSTLLWSDPKKTPNTTSYYLTKNYSQFSAAEMAANYRNNYKEIKNVDLNFVVKIENIVESFSIGRRVNPALVLNESYEKNNRQLVDGLHRIIAFLVGIETGAISKDSYLLCYVGILPHIETYANTVGNKPSVGKSDAMNFLRKELNIEANNIEEIKYGSTTNTFTFVHKEKEYVVRFSKNYENLYKDKLAYEDFSEYFSIPEVTNLGRYSKKVYYAISERVLGRVLYDLDKDEYSTALPYVIQTLYKIHTARIDKFGGFGSWNKKRSALYQNWEDFLLKFLHEKKYKQLLKDGVEHKNIFKSALTEMKILLKYTQLKDAYLVHSDYGYADVIYNPETKQVTVLDWANSMIGDFVYDPAWYDFWHKDDDFSKKYLSYIKDRGLNVSNYWERHRICQLQIGLRVLSTSNFNNNELGYAYSLNRLKHII